MIIQPIVYLLCALTSVTCAVLLLRAYFQSQVRLLFWSGLCFAALTANNLILVVGAQGGPERDLSVVRSIPSVVGIALLLYGMIWESDR